MGLFSFHSNTIKFPEFTVGVFGKLPFYKDFLYSSFDKSFSDLRDAFDHGFDTLIRSQASRPYVAPNRRLLIHLPKHKVDLVGCIWESDDGLRGFPFLIATAFPKRFKNASFAFYWQALEGYWKYLSAYYQDLRSQDNPTEFYKRVRGIAHQPPMIKAVEWTISEQAQSNILSGSINEGFLTPVDLTGLAPHEEAALLRSLTIKSNPSFVLWPSPDWRERENTEIIAYFGSNGIDDLRFNFFLPPEPSQPENQVEDASQHAPYRDIDLDEIAEAPATAPEPPNEPEPDELTEQATEESVPADQENNAETLRISRALEDAKNKGELEHELPTRSMETQQATPSQNEIETTEIPSRPPENSEKTKSIDDIDTHKMPIDRDQYK